jgi:hypothetical protein
MIRFCWHDWSKWIAYRWTGTVYADFGTATRVTETRQARRCEKCGKEIHRRVKVAAGSTFAELAEKA